jgi:drug/metabolite transporter (DMT)-like permease
MPYLWFALICTVWGGSFILMKKAVLVFSPVAVGMGRALGGAAVLALLWWWRSGRRSMTARDLPPLALVVFCGFAWPYSMQPYLVSRHGSAFVGLTVTFTPLLTIIASVPLLGIYPTRRQLLGVLGALVFLGLLLVDGWERNVPPQDLLWAVTVPLGYSVTNTVIRRSLRHVSALELTLASLALAAAVLIPLVVLHPAAAEASTGDLPQAILALLILGVIGTGLAMYLFNQLIHDHGPLFAGMVTNIIPIGALAWGWIDHEQVTPLQIAALTGLLAMVGLVQYGTVTASRLPTLDKAVSTKS